MLVLAGRASCRNAVTHARCNSPQPTYLHMCVLFLRTPHSLQERRAEREAEHETGGEPKPLGRRSYKEAVATTLPSDAAPTTTDTTLPSTAGTMPMSAGPTSATTELAGPDSSSMKMGGGPVAPNPNMGATEVEELGGGVAGAPAGPMLGTGAGAGLSDRAFANQESPKKRGFFGSLKKALAPSSSSRNEA